MVREKDKRQQRSFIPVRQKDGKEAFALRPVSEADDKGFLVAPAFEGHFPTELLNASHGPHSFGKDLEDLDKKMRYGSAPDWTAQAIIRRNAFLQAEFYQGERNKTRCKKEPVQPYPGSVWLCTAETKYGKPGEIVKLDNVKWQIGYTQTIEGEVKVGVPIRLNQKQEGDREFMRRATKFWLDDEELVRAIDLEAKHGLMLPPQEDLVFSEEANGQQLIMRLGNLGLDRLVVNRFATRESPQSNRPIRQGYFLTLVEASARLHATYPEVGDPFQNLKRTLENDELSFIPK